jgi:hypothetical protein
LRIAYLAHCAPDPCAQRELAAQCLVAREAHRLCGHIFRRRIGKFQHIDAIDAIFADATDRRGDDRQPGQHGLRDDNAKAFRIGQVEKNIAVAGVFEPAR